MMVVTIRHVCACVNVCEFVYEYMVLFCCYGGYIAVIVVAAAAAAIVIIVVGGNGGAIVDVCGAVKDIGKHIKCRHISHLVAWIRQIECRILSLHLWTHFDTHLMAIE